MSNINWEFWQYVLGISLIVILLKFTNVKKFVSNIFNIEFWKDDDASFSVNLGNTVGFVISQDGKIYKIHLNMVFLTNKKRVLNDLALRYEENSFRFKQFAEYSANYNGYIPVSPVKISTPVAFIDGWKIRAEFQAYPFKPIKFTKGLHILTLKIYSDRNIQKKIKFEVTDQNIQNYNREKKLKNKLPEIFDIKLINE